MVRLLKALLLVGAAATIGCGQSDVILGYPPDYDAGQAASTGTGGGGSTNTSGLPCDVQTLLQNNCQSCHGSRPIGGAPMSMMTYADLTAKTPTDSSKTVAQQSVIRMQDSNLPMPPTGQLSSSDIAIMQNWVNQGTPKGPSSCP